MFMTVAPPHHQMRPWRLACIILLALLPPPRRCDDGGGGISDEALPLINKALPLINDALSLGNGALPLSDEAHPHDAADDEVPLEAAFIHKWAATLAVLALQTNDGNEAGAIATVNTIEQLTIQAINATADGMPFTAQKQVLADAGINLSKDKPPINVTDEIQRLITGGVSDGVAGILGVINGNATSFLNGLITVTDPEVFADSSAKLQAAALGGILAATGVSYTPCIASAGPAGAVLFAEAIALAPELVEVSTAGAAVVAIGLNIAPTLINIGGSDKAGVAIGLGITPSLISVSPTLHENISVALDASGSPNPVIKTVNISRPFEPPEPSPMPPWPFPPDPPLPPSLPPLPTGPPKPSLPPLPPAP